MKQYIEKRRWGLPGGHPDREYAESLTAYLAERAEAQSKLSLSMFDRKPPRPKWANHRYSPFRWRAGRARA